ncbi:MAG: acyl-CoA dehydratase activase [Thermodesulfobacteriota bacterium]|nr:acyl-CoA dehydratase activase [Thermodesulfobacteriota bacterium]
MIIAGIDIGSLSGETVILKDREILSYSIVKTGADSAKTAQNAMDDALKKASISFNDIEYTIATGYGRVIVPFADQNITEISCHAKGANYLFPTVKTILDMGGQDCKAIRCNDIGKVTNFAMNDKCAAGTGRFCEVVAEVLDVPLEDIGEISLQAQKDAMVSSACAVFAKSEIVGLLRGGTPKSEILSGVHEAIASRVFALLQRVGIENDFVITGGIAKNIGVVKKIAQKVALEPLISDEPQIVGALGAALFAKERCTSKS